MHTLDPYSSNRVRILETIYLTLLWHVVEDGSIISGWLAVS